MTVPRPPRTTELLLCLLVVFAAVIYSRGLSGPYLLDDLHNLVNNPYLIIRHPSWEALKWAALSSNSGPLHRPIAMLSFALNYSIAGNMDAFSAKLVNVLLHLATGVCLFLLTRRLLPYVKIFGGGRLTGKDVDGAALMATAIWLLHPLFVSTVLYTVQRMTILSALFTVLGCLFYLEYRGRQVNRGEHGYALIAGIVLFTLLAVLSKENGALLPGFLLLLEFFTFQFRKPAAVSSVNHGLLLAVLVIPTLFIPCYLATRFAMHWDLQAGWRQLTVYQRFITEFRILPQYAAWLLFAGGRPMGLYHDDIPISRSLLHPPTTLFCGLVLLFVILTAASLARRRHIASYGLIWFLWGHILESTTLPLVPVFEHRNYLPGFGLLLCLGTAAWQFSTLLTRRELLRFSMLALLLGAPAWQLWNRVSYWADEPDFLVHQMMSHPRSPEVLLYAAKYLGDRGRYADAMKALRSAAKIDPGDITYPEAELTLRCKHEANRPVPSQLAKRLKTNFRAGSWSPTSRINYISMVENCFHTSANDDLLMTLYALARPHGGADLGLYSLIGEANVYMHRHEYEAALAAWGKAVADYPPARGLQPDLDRLRAALQRAGKIPDTKTTKASDR